MKIIKVLFFTLVFTSTINVIAQCNRMNDSLSLVDLYTSTNGDEWTTQWDLEMPLEEWSGLTFTAEGCVLTVNLESNNLSGSLPILNLSELESFDANRNQLTGVLPDFTGLLSLTNLFLHKNMFVGPLPQFSSLKQLERIILWDNQLTGTIPDYDLPNLKSFSCTDNQLTGPMPALSNCPKLESYTCSKNLLTGPIPNLTDKPDLFRITCYNNELTGSIPNFIGLPKLKFFLCYNNKLSGSLPQFENFTTLEWFNCVGNNIQGRIPEHPTQSNIVDYRVDDNDLENCYPDWVCTVQFSSTKNSKLPWGGEHLSFCDNANQIGAPCDDGIPDNGMDEIDENCLCNDAISDVKEITQHDDIQLFPNPNHGTLMIDWGLTNHTFVDISIFDQSGKCVFITSKNESNEVTFFDISGLDNGLYIVYVSTNNKELHRKKLLVIND